MTLAGSGLAQISGWVSNTDPNKADQVQLLVGKSWQSLYNNGTNWINIATRSPANTTILASGSGLIIKKIALTGNELVLNQNSPYTL
jgi:hypothetical protein